MIIDGSNKLQGLRQSVQLHLRSKAINTVAKECKVSIPQIKKWIREERLSFSQESGIGLECDNCGKMIRTGRFCAECKAKMINNLDNAYEKPKPVVQKKKEKEKERMRYLDK